MARRTDDESLPMSSTCSTSSDSSASRKIRRKSTFRPPAALLLLAAVLLLSDGVAAESEKSLYTDKDHVLELNVTTFDQTVYNQQRAFFVEFYASWCGHCIHYKPTWVQFATNLRSWTPTVQVAVVNCASEENSPLCRQHAIAAFPTVKYFKVGSKSKDDGETFHGDKYNLPEMTRAVAELARKDFERDHPAGWPKLELTPKTSTLSDLWSAASSASLLAVVVDKEPFGDGLSALINFHSKPHVHVAAVSADHPLAAQFGGVAVPALLVFKRENPHSPSFSSSEAVDFAKIQEEAPVVVDAKRTAEEVAWKQFEVQYLDLTSALHYMLTQEIPRRNTIDGHYLKVLKDWMHVLRQYLPLSAPVRRLFFRLDEFVRPLATLTADEWLAHVRRFQDELGHPLPAESKYVACRGSKPYLRGYTCGLWSTFHVVTVEAFKQNKHNPNFSPNKEVLEPLHQFVFNYLSCVECAKNFDKMAKETLSSVRTPEDTVLWLWRAHNKANQRLAGGASEDPHFPKQQFPPSVLCPKCRQPNGEFDEAEVFKFLTEYYADIKAMNVQPEPGYKVNEYADGKLKKISDKHLNPKFAAVHGSVDRLEEAEARLNGEKARPWGNGNYVNTNAQSADRNTYSLLWILIFGLLIAFAYFKYKQNRSKFWKKFYYLNDYKFMPWNKNSSSNLMKYVA
ncbi:Sulfhydryl oxidase [Aphelenchoides fujianensis]|nr:Sulfhydryl oxidase [Aphelenchoides fujianensis]